MSALGGYYSRSGTAIDSQMLRRLSTQMTQVGPDGEAFEFSTKVGMLLRPFITHEEVRRALQPTVDSDGFMIIFDGWLDNREELMIALGAGLARRDLTVPELVLTVFKSWGVKGFARLIGDFALAIWDPYQQRLYLAADALGLRPLYVHLNSERAVWASQARALVSACGLPMEIDFGYLGAFLANNIPSGSPFKGIEVVPGGHVLIVDHETATLKQYWNFDQNHEINYLDDSEYEDHFRELFSEAVSCRMRNVGPVFAELSGGVDSSSIVCLADRLLRESFGETKELNTISYVFDRSSASDERAYIQEIERFINCQSHHLPDEEYAILGKHPPTNYRPDFPTNQISYLARYDRVSEIMETAGARVLLSGIGGDQAFLAEAPGVPLELADLWLEGKPRELLRSAHGWSRVLKTPFVKILFTGALLPLLYSGRETRSVSLPIGEWFTPEFIEESQVRDHGLGPVDDLGFYLPSRATQYSTFKRTMRLFATSKALSHGHFEMRYPYLDRRLLEFALAIPLQQKLRPNESRSVVRRALRDQMPSSVLQRRTKAGPTEAFQRALLRERDWLDDLFSNSILADLDVIDSGGFLKVLHEARHGISKNPAHMGCTIAIELWLQTLVKDGLQTQETRPQASSRLENVV